MLKLLTRNDFYIVGGDVAGDVIAPRTISREVSDNCYPPFVAIGGGLVTRNNKTEVWAGAIEKELNDYFKVSILTNASYFQQNLIPASSYSGHRFVWTKSGNEIKIYVVYLNGNSIAGIPINMDGSVGDQETIYDHVNSLWDIATIPRKSNPSKVLLVMSIEDSNGDNRVVAIDGEDYEEEWNVALTGRGRIIRVYGGQLFGGINNVEFSVFDDPGSNFLRKLYSFVMYDDDSVLLSRTADVRSFGPITMVDNVSRSFGGYRSCTTIDGGSEYLSEERIKRFSRPIETASLLIYPRINEISYGPWYVSIERYLVSMWECGVDAIKPKLSLSYAGPISVEAMLDSRISPSEVYIIGDYLNLSKIRVYVRNPDSGEIIEYQRLSNKFYNPGQPIYGLDLRLKISMEESWMLGSVITGVLTHIPSANNLIYIA